MGKKRTLAERAKWKRCGGDTHLLSLGVADLWVCHSHIGPRPWWVHCECVRLSTTLDGSLAAAKARAIELVQEQIRELCKEWEVPNV